MLIDKNAIVNVSGWLLPEHFYDDRHSKIYGVIVDLFLDGVPVDLVTVADKLSKKKLLKKIGGRTYLTELADFVPTTSPAEEYGELVKEAATRRGLIASASEITTLAYDESIVVDEVVDKSENLLFNVAQAGVKTNFVHIKELLKDAYERAERADKDEAYFRHTYWF
jgi:replicative DNA helicase